MIRATKGVIGRWQVSGAVFDIFLMRRKDIICGFQWHATEIVAKRHFVGVLT